MAMALHPHHHHAAAETSSNRLNLYGNGGVQDLFDICRPFYQERPLLTTSGTFSTFAQQGSTDRTLPPRIDDAVLPIRGAGLHQQRRKQVKQ